MSAAAENAYKIIRSKIFEGEFIAGQRLKESELSQACKVSRTPVREALRRLATDGLVESIPNSGAVVADWNESEILDLYTVRTTLESLAASLAAERRTEAQLHVMEGLVAEHLRLVEADYAPDLEFRVAQINHELHHTIIEAAGSRALSAAVAQVIEAPLILRTFREYNQRQLSRSAADHEQLVAAIRARDGRLAGSTMKVHILTGLRSLLDHRE